ncbi:MAG TPA: FMN-binding negative transcriptional regulator [Chthonomonadaceae bacterium]|nr:FMN-binding negative transcriptional regulator [Chthonomonadaceae bacterium]
MYIPVWFREEDPRILHELMRLYSFATLITTPEGLPFASHLPFLLDTERGPSGTLRAHMAKANPQWQHFAGCEEALVIFQGPHAYISPSWYADQLSVPTWNYVVVHAYGAPHLLEETTTRALLQDLVETFEAPLEPSWRMDSLPEDYIAKMLRGLVGFEIEITRLEGKLKLSQNRPAADHEQVIEVLQKSGDPDASGVADWMKSREEGTGKREE